MAEIWPALSDSDISFTLCLLSRQFSHDHIYSTSYRECNSFFYFKLCLKAVIYTHFYESWKLFRNEHLYKSPCVKQQSFVIPSKMTITWNNVCLNVNCFCYFLLSFHIWNINIKCCQFIISLNVNICFCKKIGKIIYRVKLKFNLIKFQRLKGPIFWFCIVAWV